MDIVDEAIVQMAIEGQFTQYMEDAFLQENWFELAHMFRGIGRHDLIAHLPS